MANPVVRAPNSTDGGTSGTESVTRYAATLAHSFSSSATVSRNRLLYDCLVHRPTTATTTGGLKVFSPTSEPRTASSRILTVKPDTQTHDLVGHRAAQPTPRIVAFCIPEQDDDLLHAPKRSGSTGDGRKV
jgi:hypothetical protein